MRSCPNGSNFRSRVFAEQLAQRAIKHRRTRPYWASRPMVKRLERFNRTMADEFLYSFTFRSENERRRRLDRWVHGLLAHHAETTPPSAAHPHHASTTSVAPTPRGRFDRLPAGPDRRGCRPTRRPAGKMRRLPASEAATRRATEIDSTVRVPPASLATSVEKATLAVMLPTYRLIESTPAAEPILGPRRPNRGPPS